RKSNPRLGGAGVEHARRVRKDFDHGGAIEEPTKLNVWLALEPRVVMAAMQTTMMRVSITAYSTAVGPSSAFRNDTRLLHRLRMFESPVVVKNRSRNPCPPGSPPRGHSRPSGARPRPGGYSLRPSRWLHALQGNVVVHRARLGADVRHGRKDRDEDQCE